jgi:hypothetical protein
VAAAGRDLGDDRAGKPTKMPMRMVLFVAGFALACASAVQAQVPAAPLAQVAHERAQTELLQIKNDKYKWKGGGCKYQFKANHKGFKEKYKCK